MPGSSQGAILRPTIQPRHSSLPQELTDTVTDFLHDDPKSLKACSLVCRGWVSSSHLHLFHKVSVLAVLFVSTFSEFLRDSPVIARSIRILDLVAFSAHASVSQQDALLVLDLLPSLKTLISGVAFTKSDSVQLYWEHPSLALLELHDLFCTSSDHAETARFFSHIEVGTLIIRRPRLLDEGYDPEDVNALSFQRVFENWPVNSLTLEIDTDWHDKPAVFFLKIFLLGLSTESLRAFCATLFLWSPVSITAFREFILTVGRRLTHLQFDATLGWLYLPAGAHAP